MAASREHRGPQPGAGPVDVVTAFVWDGQRVLLAQRSSEVSTFPGHWAGISGYVQQSEPLDQAYQELQEECGLVRGSLVLAGAGEPLVAAAEEGHGGFRVHPFLFRVEPDVALHRDWEAARLDWVPLADVVAGVKQPAVPRLYEAFAHVWPPWPAEQRVAENLKAAQRHLSTDRTHGAAALAQQALAAAAVLIRAARPDFATLKPQILSGLDLLASCRPSMQAVAGILQEARAAIAACDSEAAALAVLDSLRNRLLEAARRSAERAATRIQPGETILVHSFSGTVLESLLMSRGRVQRVYVCEARPLYEGRQMAARLAAAGIPVTLITDAQAALVMPHVSRVLLGADAVCADGSIVNKAGSTLVALAAQRLGRPVTAVAQEIKRLAVTEPDLENAPPAEVWSDPPACIEVQNVYFEKVPPDLLTEVVTEADRAE